MTSDLAQPAARHRVQNLHIHTPRAGNATCPEGNIAVGDGKPEFILANLQQDRIIDQCTFIIADRRIFALPKVILSRLRGVR